MKMDLHCAMASWLEEEQAAHMRGWDFSHIQGRYAQEDNLPWDYEHLVRKHLRPEARLLDIDTGGGEFLLSLGHPFERTSATEAWMPNVRLCRQRLQSRGVDFRACKGDEKMPFADASFDLIINRHGSFCPEELFRMLRHGGLFITQQVGAENDRELVKLLLMQTPLPFPDMRLDTQCRRMMDAGFQVLRGEETHGTIRFFDVGALVWFAHVIAWEFPNFSVEKCLPQLIQAQTLLEQNGSVEGRTHRYLIIAQKP